VYVQKDYTYAMRAIVPVKGLWLYEVQYPHVTDEKATYYEGRGGMGVIHQQHYQYDDYGNVTQYTDAGSPDTASDDVTAIIQYYYLTGSYIMDRPAQIVVQDAAGKPYRYRIGTYNSKGQLVKLRIKNSSGDFAITDIGYDTYGNITLVRQPANSKGQRYHLQYSYDTATSTYIESITDTLGYTSTAKYDVTFGVPLWTRDVSGASMQYQYDVFGRLTMLWGPYDVGGRPAIAVEYAGAIVTGEGVSRPVGAITTNRSGGDYSSEALTVVRYADGLGRELQVKTSATVAGQYGYTVSGAKRYDAMGRVVAEGKPQFEPGASTGYTLSAMQYPTYYQYDCMGRKTLTTYPDGGEVIAGYGIRNGTLVECITDQNGNSKTLNRDTRGNIVAVTEEGNITTIYQYDVLNQLIAVVDADGNTTSITYDSMGRRIAIDNPDAGKTEYAYDDSGNLIAKQTANLKKKSQWIRYGYHFHQLKMVDNPTGDDVYYEYGAPGAAYNAAGRVTKETVGKLIDQYRYGALGEVVKKTRTIDGKTYTVHWKWDNFGRLRSIVYSNNVVIYYAYDTGGQVKQVFGYYNGTRMDYVNNVYYDEFGSRTTIAYANGVESQYSYDVLMHRLISLKTSMGDSTYQNITYSYDKVGNIVTRSENGIVMSDNTVKNITHHYGYDRLYRLTQADGFIKENGNTVNSYTSTLQYSSIGTIVQKLQTVTIAGENDPSLTYSYNYNYAASKPHAVAGINDNLTYRYDANGNMTAVYDTAKQFNRILYWDDDNRLTKTVDTTSGSSVATSYAYDAKGMRIIKDGPYGKSIYIDTGYVESGAPQTPTPIVSNHIFVGNTRVASVVKHTEEKQPATYFYASDHLGSSSVLTTQQGSYHERIEYLPYGETWVEDKATSDGYSTPYKFTGKELDAETGLYYFGARYYDARVSRWISADPALEEGKYFPKPNDFDTEHDFYWYLQQDGSKKLPGLGGVFNAVNMDVYHYAGNNPVKLVDPDGNEDIILLRDTNQKYNRFESIALIYPDNTLNDENIAKLNAIQDLTINDVMSILGNPIDDFFTSGEYKDFSTLPDDQSIYGTIAEGSYSYQMGSFKTQSGNIICGLKLFSETEIGIPQDPSVNGGINPRTGLPFLTGVWIHAAAKGDYRDPDYKAKSEGCPTSPNFNQLFNYLLMSPTGQSGKVYMRR